VKAAPSHFGADHLSVMKLFSVSAVLRLVPSSGRIQSVLAHRAVQSAATLAALYDAFRPGVTQGTRYPAPMMARLGL